MKTPHRLRFLSLLALVSAVLLAAASAQQQRFLVEPFVPDPAVSPHQDLVDAVRLFGGLIYVDVDRPEVRGNLVGALMDPGEAQALRQQRPDLRVVPDAELEPDAGTGGVPWSPDRIDQRLGTDTLYRPPMRQPCDGNRPYVYICDTGILAKHSEFAAAGARLELTQSYVPAMLPRTISAWLDPWDHGTGVAGCAVGETLGAGRCPANLVSAICYPDPGTFPGTGGSFASFAADAIYWCLNEHNNRGIDADPFNDASVLVFASSTTTGPSAILDLAVQRAYLGGMSVVVSAGNKNQDVVSASPAGATSTMGDITLTVAASTVADARWPTSNFGGLVELHAPGENVPTASATGPSACLIRSGTSFSAGYVAGAAARLLSRNPWAPPAAVAKVLTDLTNTNFGPSGPFGLGINAVPKLLYVHPSSIECIPMLFPDWMAFFGTDPDGPTDDPDCDGLVNGVEYAMALDPTVWAKEAERPRLVFVDSGARYHFRLADYTCPEGAVSVLVEYSTDLSQWTSLPAEAMMSDEEAPCIVGATWMVASIPVDGVRLYVRLRVLGL